MKRLLLALSLLYLVKNISIGQICYTQIEDQSGFNTDEFQPELQQEACSLVATFPEEFQSQFKVFSFGFYVLTENFQGAYESAFSRLIQEIPSQFTYYLLIGRQSDRFGIYTKFYVNLRLPDSGIFACLTESQIRVIEETIKLEIETTYQFLGSSPNDYAKAEIAGMKYLKRVIEQLISGNCCLISADEIRRILVNNGYQGMAARISDDVPLPLLRRPNSITSRSGSGSIEDFTNQVLELEEYPGLFDLGQSLEPDLFGALDAGINANVFITKNSNICENGIGDQIVEGFANAGYDAHIHAHYWENPDTTKPDTLYVGFKIGNATYNYDFPEVTVSDSYWECGPEPLPSDQNDQYAITQDEGTYFGYHAQEENWVKSDPVSYDRPINYNVQECDHCWGNGGAYTNYQPGFIRTFFPSFRAWWLAHTPKLNPTRSVEKDFHFFFLKPGLGFKEARQEIFQQFKYANFNPPSSTYGGTSKKWACDSKVSQALAEVETVKTELGNLKNILEDWLTTHENFDGLFLDRANFSPAQVSNPSLSGLPLWTFAAFGGTQGIKIEIKSFKSSQCLINSNTAKRYEFEVIFTIYDIFGNGVTDAARWYFPGLVELWVLQHYRNYDCDNRPCYIPISNHSAEIYEKMILCIDK